MVAVDDTHGAFLNVDGIFEVLLMFGWLYVLGFSLIYEPHFLPLITINLMKSFRVESEMDLIISFLFFV